MKGEKAIDEDGNFICRQCFSKFIEINQELVKQEITHNYKMCNSKTAMLCFYKTKKVDPIFTFEDGIEKIVECLLDS